MSQYTANKYPAKCCRCGQPVAPFEGILLRERGQFVVEHAACNDQYEEPDRFDMQVEDNMRDACGPGL